MKTLFAVAGIVEMLTGVALTLASLLPVTPIVGLPPDVSSDKALPLLGVVLVALGLAFWLARGDSRSPAGQGLAVALLVYNMGFAAIICAAALGSGGPATALWPAFGIHAGLAAWCVWAMRAGSRPPAAARG